MFRWWRMWLLMLITLTALVLATVFFGLWGFFGEWLSVGLVAFGVFLWDWRGQPGPPITIQTVAEDVGVFVLIVISGPAGLWLMCAEMLEPEARSF